MGTGSLAVFLLCILCKIFCRLHVAGKLWAAKCHPKRACGLNIALLIFKMYITLKPVVISNTFLMLPYLGKTVKEHGKKHVKWVKEHSQEPRSHGAKIIPIFLQSTGPHVRQVCAVIFVSCGTRRAKDKVKIPWGAKMSPFWRVGMQDSMVSKPLNTSVGPESCSSSPAVPRVP